jgi:hypothetical protein
VFAGLRNAARQRLGNARQQSCHGLLINPPPLVPALTPPIMHTVSLTG